MQIAIENLPIIFLSIIGIGVAIIVISVIRLAGSNEQAQDYYVAGDTSSSQEDTTHLEELFSYFLEEEEKKNDAFRQLMLEQSKAAEVHAKKTSSFVRSNASKDQMDQNTFNEIIRRYEQGEDPQTIAKSLRKGIGEVKLILSLYTMR